MRTDQEKELLLRSVDHFKRKIIVLSRDYKVLAANAMAADGKDQIVGDACYKVFQNLEKPCTDCALDKVVSTGKAHLMKGSDCTLLPTGDACQYFCPMFQDKDVDAVVMMDFGIPILEGLEERLQRSNAFFYNLILSSVDAVLAADRTGKIIIFNDSAAEITGYSAEEALSGLNIRSLYPGKGASQIMKKLRSGNGKLKSYQMDILRKDGTTIPISVNAAIVHEGNTEVATIGFFHDLRETIKIKKELEKTQLQLLQAEKMASLGKLAAGVAHQLNNPLGGITLFTKLVLEEYNLEPAAREDLKRILLDAERCRDTVKELLEFARQTRLCMQPHDINRAISRTLFLLENQTIFHNIHIVKNFNDDLPMVTADIQQLNHMFMNIILNAADAMQGNGTLTVSTKSVPEKQAIEVEIKDTGHGIPEDIISHIFEPFFTTKEEGKGTGLGLSLVYSIIENHGGNISVKSKINEGTSFIIALPLKGPSAPDDECKES